MSRKVIIGGLLAFIVVGIAAMIGQSIRVNRPIESSHMEEKGNFLPTDLEFTRYENKEKVKLGDYKGKVILINFWASWCGACIEEMPSIQKLYEALHSDGLEVFVVNVEDNPEAFIPKIQQRIGLKLPIFLDVGGILSERFEVSAIPFTIVTNRKHEIIWAESGEKDWFSPKVIQEIKQLLN